MISPVLEKLSIEVYPDAVFAKVDVDEAPDVAAECGIRAMPTIICYKKDEELDRFSAANPSAIEGMIKRFY